MVFNREKVLDLTVNRKQHLEIKNLSLTPKATSNIGEKLLKSQPKFWIIYAKLIEDKLRSCEINRQNFKNLILSYLDEAQYDNLLVSELEGLIDFDIDKENIPSLLPNEKYS